MHSPFPGVLPEEGEVEMNKPRAIFHNHTNRTYLGDGVGGVSNLTPTRLLTITKGRTCQYNIHVEIAKASLTFSPDSWKAW